MIDLKLLAAITCWRIPRLDRDAFLHADPYGVRFGILTEKEVVIRRACLTIELQPRSSQVRVENFFITLIPAFSNRAIWSLRRRPSYWRIEPADIHHFLRLQSLMRIPDFDQRFQHADLRAYTRRIHTTPVTTRAAAPSLYLQLMPNNGFTLLSRNAYQPTSLMFQAEDWSHASVA